MIVPVAIPSAPKQAAKIALAYLGAGAAWILLSDYVLHATGDPALIGRFQSFKGIIFVIITSVFIYALGWWQLALPARLLRELRDGEARFRGTFEQAAVGMAHVDLEGRFLRVNKRMCDFLGYGLEEFQRLSVEDIAHPDDLSTDREESRRLLAGEIDKFSIEKRYRHRGGDYLWGELTASLVDDEAGRPWFFVKVAQDIGRRKAAEEALRESEARLRLLNADLEKRVTARTAELEAVNNQLEAFAYSVSHDLKAPLRGIDGYSHLLEEDHADALDEEGRLFVTNIRRGVRQMTELIDDLLAYSRTDRRPLLSRPLTVAHIVSAVVGERAEEIKRRGIVLRTEVEGLHVLADPEGLSLVIRNLLDNAIKFAGDAAQPRIEIGGREDGAACVLWVRDNGIGFDIAFKDRIFDIFQRLHGPDSYPGTGIGLAIVRKAMDRMGGRAWAEGEKNKGATFFLSLPANPAGDAEVPGAGEQGGNDAGRI